MKRKIDNKDLNLISGGEILRSKNGTYILKGRSDKGNNIYIKYRSGDLFSAVEYEWILCENAIRKAGIADNLEELMNYYERKFCYEIPDDFNSQRVGFIRRK